MKKFNVLSEPLKAFNINEDYTSEYIVDHLIGGVFFAYKLYKEKDENILLLTSTFNESSEVFNALLGLVDEEDIIVVPSDELIRVEYISQSKEMVAEQIDAIYKMINTKHKIVIASIQSLYKFYPSKELFLSSIINLKVGDEINLIELRNKLSRIGYIRQNKVNQSLTFAQRGDILDVFSLNYEEPIRIEFFGDEIESIRQFSIGSQTSNKSLSEALILPASLNLLSDHELENFEQKLMSRYEKDIENNKDEKYKETLLDNLKDDIELIKQGDFSNKFYKYMGFLQDFHCNLGTFLENYTLININENNFNKTKDLIEKDSLKFLMDLHKNAKTISHLEYFDMKSSLSIKTKKCIYLNEIFSSNNDQILEIKKPSISTIRQNLKANIFSSYKNLNYKIICLLHNPIFYKKTVELLKALDYSFSETSSLEIDLDDLEDIILINNKFDISYEISDQKIVVLTERDIYGTKRHSSTFKNVFKEGSVIGGYEELSVGDYVVHEDYGIGRYEGIQTIDINHTHQDYMKISYANDENLYVPLYQFNVVRKYVGREGRAPALSRLSSNQWNKTKQKIKERVNELADRLLTLYQERQKSEGISFGIEDDLQINFENEFSYPLTLDQEKALREIKEDMESSTPMDRLLCGDVGFGKTEVAFRAAFKALNNGKKVALICPTTLLALQHFDVAVDRFKNYDFGIGILSRLQSVRENNETREGIKSGKINFIIGTHAVLSKNVEFKDLGLLIIDEEQRFGVEQKERIKEKFPNIDVLTLSATPIPRTLQSTLIGLKTTSTINTPPKDRMPIQTYVIPFDLEVVRELINRELSRRGQAFYVYNRVASIYDRANELQDLIPNAVVGVIHAKMDKKEIEKTMYQFYMHQIDVLVTTSIIENGIDVKNANLILIEDADRFGLAQLYQIKGRVGRGDRLAFAYLMINSEKGVNEEAQKRLKAIQDFTELGSGYKISQRDLLIRGAGDILGPEQAGFIDSIGIDLYIKILNETVEEKKNLNKAIYNEKKLFELTVDGYIPESFANNEDKLELYQKIIGCKDIDKLEILHEDVADIFGKIPVEVETLFIKKKIEIYISYRCFYGLKEFSNNLQLTLSNSFSQIDGIGTELFTSLIPLIKLIKISYENRKIKITINKEGNYVDILLKIIKIVIKLSEVHKEQDSEAR